MKTSILKYLLIFSLVVTALLQSCGNEETTTEENTIENKVIEGETGEPVEEMEELSLDNPIDSSVIIRIRSHEELIEALKAIKDGDTLSFNGVILGQIVLENLNNITLLGNDSTFFYIDDNGKLLFDLVGCNNIVIDGFYMMHHPPEAECQEGVISLVDCKNISVTNNNISGSGYYGIRMEESDSITILNNNIHDCSYAGISMDVNLEYNITVKQNTFSHNGWTNEEHIIYRYDSNTPPSLVETYNTIIQKQLLSNETVTYNYGFGYVYANLGLNFYNDKDELISIIPFKEKVKLFPLEDSAPTVSEDSIFGKKQNIEYNGQQGWVCNAYLFRFPITATKYYDLSSYLIDNGELISENHFQGHSSGEMYAEITIRRYKEGVCLINDLGWEWGSVYNRIYDASVEQMFFFAQNSLKRFDSVKFPKDNLKHTLVSSSDETGKVTKWNKASFYQNILKQFEIDEEAESMGAYSTTIHYFNDQDLLMTESFGF